MLYLFTARTPSLSGRGEQGAGRKTGSVPISGCVWHLIDIFGQTYVNDFFNLYGRNFRVMTQLTAVTGVP